MQFDPLFQPYPSIRQPVYANRGMVATSTPQAAAAGLEMLRLGGNAVDAAIAAASTLTVVEPTANGIGSDAFALVWIQKDRRLYGLNASGRAPMSISIDKLLPRAVNGQMPVLGWAPTMVPGAVKGWAALIERFGSRTLAQALAPAIAYADEGFPVPPDTAASWAAAGRRYAQEQPEDVFAAWFHTFCPGGHTPGPGQIVRLPDHAATLAAIARSNGEDFYRGELMRRIIADSKRHGGFFGQEDFTGYEIDWVDPISLHYRGYDVCEIPPNGQGLVALMALNILSGYDYVARDHVDTVHLQWEAMKIAFTDGLGAITDPKYMQRPAEDFLSASYGEQARARITHRAGTDLIPTLPQSGTVYLCTADADGNMVSYIQSNYMGFGSGVVVKDTGIALQNRGHDFSLDPEHPNCLAPGKRSYHTIIPGFLMKNGEAVGPFGVMGGYMQPQGHVQTVMNLIDFGLNPQQALDAPRWQWLRDGRFVVEPEFSREIAIQLLSRGHRVSMALDRTAFGRGQIILKGTNDVLIGGTEKRTNGTIASW